MVAEVELHAEEGRFSAKPLDRQPQNRGERGLTNLKVISLQSHSVALPKSSGKLATLATFLWNDY